MWILFFLFCSIAQADVFVVTAPDKSVYSISEQRDCVIPQGYAEDVIKGKDINSLALGDDLFLYNYNGKKFTLDDKKVAKKNKDLSDAALARETKKATKASAITKLEALGLTTDEAKAIVE
jgi:hypothetical protein